MPKSEYPQKGERAAKSRSLRQDIESAADGKGKSDDTVWCPKCGAKISATGAVGGAGG